MIFLNLTNEYIHRIANAPLELTLTMAVIRLPSGPGKSSTGTMTVKMKYEPASIKIHTMMRRIISGKSLRIILSLTTPALPLTPLNRC
jgi:hypothetical protein